MIPFSNSLSILTNDSLVEVFHQALDHNVEDDFLQILLNEIKNRENLTIHDVISECCPELVN